MTNFKNIFDDLLKDETLTGEQKGKIINECFDIYRKSIDRDLNNYLTKQYVGAGFQIGSAAIPMSGAANVGTKIGIDLFAKTLGKKIAGEVGAGMVSGMASGAVFGLGRGLSEDENVLKTIYYDSIYGMYGGMLGGGLGAYAKRFIDGKLLKKYGDIDILPHKQRQQYNTASREYYKNYNQGIELGDINFTNRGVQETMRWNPKQAQYFPELLNDIKNANRLPDVPNLKPHQKPNVSHYEVYQGKNGLHHVEVFKNGDKRFYITKESPASTYKNSSLTSKKGIVFGDSLPVQKDTLRRATPTTSWDVSKSIVTQKSDSTIINDFNKNLNPATVMIPGMIFGNNPSITKDTPVGTPLTTSQGSTKSIPGANSAYPIQTRAQDLEPSTIINDVGKNLNPATVMIPGMIFGNNPSITKDTSTELTRATSTVPSKSIPGSNSAYPIQTRAQDLEPSTIINDVNKNLNPAQSASHKQYVTGDPFKLRAETFDWRTMPLANPWKNDKGTTTGFAAPVETVQVFTPEQIGKMSRKEFAQNEFAIMSQMKDGLIQNQSPLINFSGFINPVTGSKQIFSREDIGAMSTEEYSNNEKAINAQLNSIGVPTFSELKSAVSSGGGVIYVEPYTRSNGVQVRGYYRSR